MATVFQLIAIFSQSAALLGPWWCLGAMQIVPLPHSKLLHSAWTLQWTRTPRTGSCTAWVCQEWNPCRVTPLTGEQHAVTQPTVWIFEITFEETSKISTLSITLEKASVRRSSLSTSEDTRECTKQHVSGRKRGYGACTSIVRMLAVSSIHLLARLGAKIILVFTGIPTQSSAAPRMIIQQHSGGLEVICEEHDLSYWIPLSHSPISFIGLLERKTRRWHSWNGLRKESFIKSLEKPIKCLIFT